MRPPGAWVAKLSGVFSHINKDRVASLSVVLHLWDACRDRTSSAQQGQEVFVILQNEMLSESHIFETKSGWRYGHSRSGRADRTHTSRAPKIRQPNKPRLVPTLTRHYSRRRRGYHLHHRSTYRIMPVVVSVDEKAHSGGNFPGSSSGGRPKKRNLPTARTDRQAIGVDAPAGKKE